MKDSIPKKLTEHIRKTVGRYETPYEPGSWEEFQRLQRQRQQRQPLVWFRYAMAACLLLGLLGVPLWLYLDRSEPSGWAVSRPKTGLPDQKEGNPAAKNRQPADPVSTSQPFGPQGHEKPLHPNALAQTRPAWKNTAQHPKEVSIKSADYQTLTLTKNQLKHNSKPAKPGFSTDSDPVFEQEPTGPLPATDGPPRFSQRTEKTASFEPIPTRFRTFYRWPERPLGLPLTAQPAAPTLAKTAGAASKPKPVLGVSLSPQSVYAAGSAPAMAVGGGLFSEIPVTKRFSLSTGLLVARQTLGTKESGLIPMSTLPHRVATDIRLVAVDLPVNLRFRPFKSAQTGFYIETGLSSLAFLNEQYAETYEQLKPVTVSVMGTNGQEQTVTQYVTAQQIVNRSEPAFRQIYWGRIVNVSVGVERRISDRLRLSAEPYLKYPLGPFTRENLQLGSGGVSLRLGFSN
ncbi:hypothetical protein GCM10027299_14810 [Larkinella ripae]